MLTEIKAPIHHYFIDKDELMQGEYKRWWENGNIREQEWYKNGKLHGLCRYWWEGGKLVEHYLYQNGLQVPKEITEQIMDLVKNICTPTMEERILVKLKWGVDLL